MTAVSEVSRSLTAHGDVGLSLLLREASLASSGLDEEDRSRPIIGIAASTSDFTPCHRHMPELIKAQPMDAVVLPGGCDETVPAQLMSRDVSRDAR